MSGYILSTASVLDLESIWDYIAADSVDAADRWIGKLFDAFDALAITPRMGHKREDLTAHPSSFGRSVLTSSSIGRRTRRLRSSP